MKARLTKLLTFKYANIQIPHNLLNCVIGSYAAVFLKYKGFTNTEVGLALSTAAILSIIIQPLIASFADKTDKLTLRQINMFLMLINFFLGFIMLFGSNLKPILFFVFILASSLQLSLTSVINALAVEYINKGVLVNFGLARGLGSLMFAIFSLALGFLIEVSNPNIIIPTYLILYFLLFWNTFLFRLKPSYQKHLNLTNKDKAYENETSKTTASTFAFLKKYKKFTVFLIGVTLMYYSYLMINTYLINIVESFGGNSEELGIGLALAAALELPVMASFTKLLKRFKCSSIIKFSAIFYIAKAVLTLAASNMAMIYIAQATQLFNFALFTPACLYYVNMVITEKDSVRGQSMITIATFGLAGVLSNVSGGIIQDTLGIKAMLIIGLIVTTIGVITIFYAIEDTGTGTNG
ncbi:MAG TPA: MFS transporter [Clostridiales bacterium]|nr:MFS transporter [Clostridiales bacterium]